MTTLHDRLEDLADQAPGAAPTSDLWRRGRREHRARRAGTAVIVAVALIAVGSTLATWRVRAAPVDAAPAAGAAAAVPNRIFTPSPWLPGTDETGAPGPLSATVSAQRGSWSGSSAGVVGIVAATQDYRFLDLPGYEGGDTALSPDGRKVAWWTAGEPSGDPNTGSGPVITGYAVYDTVSGDVDRLAVPTEHGLGTTTLAWADDDVLLADYGQWAAGDDGPLTDQALAVDNRLESWRAGSAPVALTEAGGSFASTPGDGRVLVSRGDGYAVLDAATARTITTFKVGTELRSGPVLAPGGTRFAAQVGSRSPAPVSVAPVRRSDDLRTVPDSDGFGAVGWAGPDAVVVLTSVPGQDVGSRLMRVEVDGDRRVVTTVPGDVGWDSVHLASDLLDVPSSAAVEPARPLDPRLVTGLVGGTVLVAGAAVLAWRRRRVRLS